MRASPGSSAEQARSELTALTRDAFGEVPFTITPIVTPLDLQIAGDVRAPSAWLLAAVGAVLLGACVNVASLLSARGLSPAGSRARSTGDVRSSLRASPRDGATYIARPLLGRGQQSGLVELPGSHTTLQSIAAAVGMRLFVGPVERNGQEVSDGTATSRSAAASRYR